MRGEGNHKIPGSFAPENMEKAGAERVKYSLACQHEDAISIKFVSYAQKCPTVLCTFAVALRKESVDRNSTRSVSFRAYTVALRKESVDRNNPPIKPVEIGPKSLSARRAWIEISPAGCWRESRRSLSARRAWIEMEQSASYNSYLDVALRKESVDRNIVLRPMGLGWEVVALRKESVDRNNTMQVIVIVMDTVALRKESVDRNCRAGTNPPG